MDHRSEPTIEDFVELPPLSLDLEHDINITHVMAQGALFCKYDEPDELDYGATKTGLLKLVFRDALFNIAIRPKLHRPRIEMTIKHVVGPSSHLDRFVEQYGDVTNARNNRFHLRVSPDHPDLIVTTVVISAYTGSYESGNFKTIIGLHCITDSVPVIYDKSAKLNEQFTLTHAQITTSFDLRPACFVPYPYRETQR